MSGVVHIAGLDVRVGSQLRQRCGWCGAVIIDVNLANIMTLEGDEMGYPTWKVGGLVAVDGNATYIVEHTDGEQLPAECCGALEPEVTA